MAIDDILGLGKILPIDKLFDIVSKTVGKISKPYFDRKDVNTRAYEIEKLAEARAKEMKIISNAIKENFQQTGGIDYNEGKLAITSPKSQENQIVIQPSLIERTNERLDYQEFKRQSNIENITSFAAEELKNEPPINDEPIDEDWATRFFRIVEDISNEEMQALWGKILAGEIKQPKSFSLRTLDLLRNLSKTEAETFLKVAQFAIKTDNTYYLFKGEEDNILDKKYNIHYSDLALLTEIGLLQSGTFVTLEFLGQPQDSQEAFFAGKFLVVVKSKANTPTFQLPVDIFTNAGNELLKLVESNPPFDYVKAIFSSIKSDKVDVKFGNILAIENNKIQHTMPLKDFD